MHNTNTSQNDNGPDAASIRPANFPTNLTSNFKVPDASVKAAHDAEQKAIATLVARFAMAGHVVHQAAGRTFIVTRWGLARYCKDFEALAAFAHQVGVSHD